MRKLLTLACAVFIMAQLSISSLAFFSDGRAVVWEEYDRRDETGGHNGIASGTNRKYGAVDTNGDIVIPTQYDWMSDFSEGLAVVRLGGRNEQGSYEESYGYVDTEGKLAIPMQFAYAEPFSEGLARVQLEYSGEYGYINKQGEVVIPPQFANAGGFHEGLAYVMYIVDKSKPYIDGGAEWYYIDTSGNKALQIPSDRIPPEGGVYSLGDFNEGVASVVMGGRFLNESGAELFDLRKGYINKSGELFLPFKYNYSQAGGSNRFKEGLAIASADGKFGYIDTSGNFVITFPSGSIYVYEFNEDLAGVITVPGESGGYIDKQGNTVIDMNGYDLTELRPFTQGLAVVRKDGKFGAIDKTGALVFPLEYDSMSDFNEGYALATKNNELIVLKATGEVSVPPLSSELITDEANPNISVGIKVRWNPVDGAESYRIDRTNSSGVTSEIADVHSTVYVDLNIEAQEVYTYSVTAIMPDGTEKLVTENVTSATVTSEIAPPLPDANGVFGPAKAYILMQIDNPMMDVNGTRIEVDPGRGTAPVLRQDRTVLPIRAVTEAMSGTVDWDGSELKATLQANGKNVEMWIGRTDYTVDGETKSMDIAPFIENDRTMLPLRFAAGNLNCRVTWLNETREILIVFNGTAKA